VLQEALVTILSIASESVASSPTATSEAREFSECEVPSVGLDRVLKPDSVCIRTLVDLFAVAFKNNSQSATIYE
jgi:hypothetical protein